MRRATVFGAGALLLLAGSLLAREDVQKGTIKKLDLNRMVLTLTTGGKERDFLLDDNTGVIGGKGDTLKEHLQGFKRGADVLFKAAKKNGQDYLVGLKLGGDGKDAKQGERVTLDTSQLVPLTELGTKEYHGFKGGLYPEGKNDRPAAHEAAGVQLARQVQPRDSSGKPSPDGKIVLLSVGMSNTNQASDGFKRTIRGDRDVDPHVRFVNGAVSSMTAAAIQDPADGGSGAKYWAAVDERLRAAGATRDQVQAIWIKEADAGPTQGFPRYARTLQDELTRIVQLLPQRFPNLKLVYLSSRTYGGFARSRLNPEPYAYESAFAVKWLIERQLEGDTGLNFDASKGQVKAPWLSWGPYLWANGTVKRADGFRYEERDFAPDGTHLTASGQDKVGTLLLRFFKTDSTTRPWFVRADAGSR